MNKILIGAFVLTTAIGVATACGGDETRPADPVAPATTIPPLSTTTTETGADSAVASATPTPEVTDVPTAAPQPATPEPVSSDGLEGSSAPTTALSNPPSACLKFRVIPQLNSPTAGCVPSGTLLQIIGGPTTGDGYQWFEVSSADGRGWVSGEYLIMQ